MKSIGQIISGFTNWGKALTIAFSIMIGASGGIVAYNKWIIQRHNEDQTIENTIVEFGEMQQNFNVVIDSIASLSFETRAIKNEIEQTNNEIYNLTKANNNLRAYMIEHATSKDDILEVLRIWDGEKKNNSLMTPSNSNN